MWVRQSVLAFALFVLSGFSAHAQTVTAELNIGSSPQTLVVNPVTNKIYVVDAPSGAVFVIDGASGNLIAETGVINNPVGIAVNTVTNKVYVTGAGESGGV